MTKARVRVAAFFGLAGISHLTYGRKFFENIVPPWLPASPKTINQAAGVAEVTGGVLAITPGAQKLARKYLTALLLAVFPANVHMVLRPEDSGSQKIPSWMLWARLPLQFVLIAWVHKALPDRPAAPAVESAE